MDSNKSTQLAESKDFQVCVPKIFGYSKLFSPISKQFLESARPQEFSFRIALMKYIWENPLSPNLYEKLIKSCKLFFIKNPMLVINTLEYFPANGWKCCKNNGCSKTKPPCNHVLEKIDMKKMEENKIWVSKSFCVVGKPDSNIASSFIPKIFRYNVAFLKLASQNLTFDELKFLATGVKRCHLFYNFVKYKNGKEVPLEEIVKLFTGAEKVAMNFVDRSINVSCKNYADFVNACGTVKEVHLSFIPAAFNVPEFYQYLKGSKNRALIKIHSKYDRNHLDQIINEILDADSFAFVPPVIEYFEHDETKANKMKEIQAREAAKYQ